MSGVGCEVWVWDVRCGCGCGFGGSGIAREGGGQGGKCSERAFYN